MKAYSSYMQVLLQNQSRSGFQAVLRSLLLVTFFFLALPLLVLLLGMQLLAGMTLLLVAAVRNAKGPFATKAKAKTVWSNGEKVINPM
ncbi:hypothetical protein [Motilimonas eburnea]|uniref:hypothetical protein n=1 Tax=Motilimonas eburnea TaxID=1737488 RepID=UPI001E581F8C|nr:hypothetical protein [Motilimonas eburnea]MCE2571301.1 hypothetical protein [Motilimonas eburnea]